MRANQERCNETSAASPHPGEGQDISAYGHVPLPVARTQEIICRASSCLDAVARMMAHARGRQACEIRVRSGDLPGRVDTNQRGRRTWDKLRLAYVPRSPRSQVFPT